MARLLERQQASESFGSTECAGEGMIRSLLLALVLAPFASATTTTLVVNIADYGARSGAIHTRGSGAGRSLTVGVNTFQDGDGITIVGAGAAPAVARPAAPSVRTGGTKSLTQIDAPIEAGSYGGSTYAYKVIARDIGGGHSAASEATMIANGPAALGRRQIELTRMRTTGVRQPYPWGYVMTAATARPHGLAPGYIVHVTNTTGNAIFGGWWPVYQTPDARTFRVLSPYLSTAGSATGGRITYFVANQIQWRAVSGAFDYVICGRRPGDRDYHIIGVSLPSTPGFTSTTFDDFGAAFRTGPAPFDMSDADCNATRPKNDNFTTTVGAGGGTKQLTLAAAMPHDVSGAAVRRDAAPAIEAAEKASQGLPVYIPPGSFEVNSSVPLSYTRMWLQAGTVVVNATVQMSGAARWSGWGQGSGAPQFSYGNGRGVQCQAYPCVLIIGGSDRVDNLTFSIPDNGAGVVTEAGFPAVTFSYVNFTTSGGSDNTGMAFVVYPGAYGYEFDHTDFLFGPGQVIDQTWSPLLYALPSYRGCCGGAGSAGGFKFDSVMMNRRGMLIMANGGAGIGFDCQHCYRQGGITPMFTFQNMTGVIDGAISINYGSHDTESQALLALWGGVGGKIAYSYVNDVSVDRTTRPEQVTGGYQYGAEPNYVLAGPPQAPEPGGGSQRKE